MMPQRSPTFPGVADRPWPAGFRFGVATAGFQVEGGYNGRGEPANDWAGWEGTGRVEPSGIALDFWNRYEDHLDRAVAAGCDAFRLSVEWARCEPAEGEVDDAALGRYAAVLDACSERGLRPMVTLHHFTHPAWAGADFWLRLDAPERFAAWVATAVGRLEARCRHWVTVNEVNAYALNTYLTGVFPPGRRLDLASTLRCLDSLLAGHVLAYGVVHAASPGAVVSTNNYRLSAYELDRLLVDVLLARSHGVGRHELHAWLVERRAAHDGAWPAPTALERWLRRRTAAAVPLEQALPRALAAVYASPHERCLDVVQVDYYDPVVSHHLRPPGHRTAGGRRWRPDRALWDDPPDPAGLARALRLAAEPGLGLEVVENGLCNRVRRGVAHPRADGWDRERFLRENLAAVTATIDAGVPVGAYYHWTLADNYEWGSYEARFGLYGVDRERGLCWSDRDSMGADAAGAYHRLADGLRAGDRTVLRTQDGTVLRT